MREHLSSKEFFFLARTEWLERYPRNLMLMFFFSLFCVVSHMHFHGPINVGVELLLVVVLPSELFLAFGLRHVLKLRHLVLAKAGGPVERNDEFAELMSLEEKSLSAKKLLAVLFAAGSMFLLILFVVMNSVALMLLGVLFWFVCLSAFLQYGLSSRYVRIACRLSNGQNQITEPSATSPETVPVFDDAEAGVLIRAGRMNSPAGSLIVLAVMLFYSYARWGVAGAWGEMAGFMLMVVVPMLAVLSYYSSIIMRLKSVILASADKREISPADRRFCHTLVNTNLPPFHQITLVSLLVVGGCVTLWLYLDNYLFAFAAVLVSLLYGTYFLWAETYFSLVRLMARLKP